MLLLIAFLNALSLAYIIGITFIYDNEIKFTLLILLLLNTIAFTIFEVIQAIQLN